MYRCEWCLKDPIYVEYHDKEWGVPVFEDNVLFEFLILESMQAGLSWLTILKKRESFRKSFDNFNYYLIKDYDINKINSLISEKNIIRNKSKILSVINNAECFIKIQREYGSFSNYIWGFVNFKQIVNKWDNIKQVPVKSELSDIITEDLKKRGFKHIGTKIIYSYLQAIGIINDHITSCFRYNQISFIP